MPVLAVMLGDESAPPPSPPLAAGAEGKAAECRRYQRGHFVALFPVRHLYTPGHAWLAASNQTGDSWRVGFTKFALRMLGELVEIQFTAETGQPVQPGDILGSIEGFKAISDFYCVGRGTFAGMNPELADSLSPVAKDPHGEGWLYGFHGEPCREALSVEDYCTLLDQTIDRLLASEQQQENL